jgi:salicylate hydroxylase/6-hydroxynicotinate 3-monooxygenase
VKPDRSEIYLVTSQPEPEFRIESWSAKGDVHELAQGVRRLRSPGRAGAGRVSRRAQMGDRRSGSARPLGGGQVTLLGDACHPDDALLWRRAPRWRSKMPPCCRAASTASTATALQTPSAASRRRAGAHLARAGDLARQYLAAGKTDADWVYGYDAWTVPLAA